MTPEEIANLKVGDAVGVEGRFGATITKVRSISVKGQITTEKGQRFSPNGSLLTRDSWNSSNLISHEEALVIIKVENMRRKKEHLKLTIIQYIQGGDHSIEKLESIVKQLNGE